MQLAFTMTSIVLVARTQAVEILWRQGPRHPTPSLTRCFCSTRLRCANPLPQTLHAPPPPFPAATASLYEGRSTKPRERVEALKEQHAQLPGKSNPKSSPNRFWSKARAVEVEDGFQIHLDKRPVRTASKSILTIPKSKPLLAAAIALEWDLIEHSQQALKSDFIPLTSLVARAHEIDHQDIEGESKTRQEIVDMVMRYLDTDTLLCWAPEQSSTEQTAPGLESRPRGADGKEVESLRDIQIRTALPIIAHLTTHIWPGVEIHPVADDDSIIPTPQPQNTRDVIRGWVTGLSPYELAGLERAVLAGKGLLGAARLVVEWSLKWDHIRRDDGSDKPTFGAEEAAEAASLEVRYQTGVWGEVEDTHDVEKVDLRRQLGSVILLLSEVRMPTENL